MKLKVLSTTTNDSSIEVPDSIFALKVNPALIAQAIRVYQANQRQATAKTKTRSEINRTKKKWFKQKGTGNARHGARTSNVFVGGGVSHGPTGLENWKLTLSKKQTLKALALALSAQAKHIFVVNEINKLHNKTSRASQLLQKLNLQGKILVVLDKANMPVVRSFANFPLVVLTTVARLNAYQVSAADVIIVTNESLTLLEQRFSVNKTHSALKIQPADNQLVEFIVAKPNKKNTKVTVKKRDSSKVVNKKNTKA